MAPLRPRRGESWPVVREPRRVGALQSPIVPSAHAAPVRSTTTVGRWLMRKTMATVVVLGLVWIGYTAWPPARHLRCVVSSSSARRARHSGPSSRAPRPRARCGQRQGTSGTVVVGATDAVAVSTNWFCHTTYATAILSPSSEFKILLRFLDH